MEQQQGQRRGRSELFTLRIWRQVPDEGEVEWRGRIQHVLGGEVYYFRGWPMLIEQLLKLLPRDEAVESKPAEPKVQVPRP